MPLNRRKFMNTYIDDITLKEALHHIEYCIENKKIGQVIAPNVDQIVRIEWDEYFKEICEKSELMILDGHPLLWIARLYKKPFKEKICGSDLIPLLCGIAEKKAYSVFFLGAAPGVAEKAARNLKNQYKKLKISGCYSPPYGFEKKPDEIKKINEMLLASEADMLFVGMGVPKQEIFIYENMHIYRIPMSFSVGATIDFLAGVQKRAPKWCRKIGMEWLFRLINNPKRMFKRYIIDDMKIIKLIFKYYPKESR
ncbi:MAG: WecB/TagA/CpsF family glycosyltransferase [Lachnospiraceae bacterium]|nr:WecB/TagA/CpsF family glycosyltransferase [Lachnospiraceae bacterium]